MRYHLEIVTRELKKYEYSHVRRAAPTFHTWRWKQAAVCDELQPLKDIAKKNCRIIDTETGEEVYRTSCPDIW